MKNKSTHRRIRSRFRFTVPVPYYKKATTGGRDTGIKREKEWQNETGKM